MKKNEIRQYAIGPLADFSKSFIMKSTNALMREAKQNCSMQIEADIRKELKYGETNHLQRQYKGDSNW